MDIFPEIKETINGLRVDSRGRLVSGWDISKVHCPSIYLWDETYKSDVWSPRVREQNRRAEILVSKEIGCLD
jgi:hypothetical protein